MASLPVQLGRYQVAGLLATGGMAEVLLGRDIGPSGFERPVVIKRILPHLARDPKFVDMFLDEARIVATIRHANVVQVHELLQHDDELVLVMEYLEGESIDTLVSQLSLRELRMPTALAAHIVAAACAGLHAAHELTDGDGGRRELVHRDVTPHNLFVTYDGQVKVIDFGIALAAGRASKTETGHIKGKFSYMSPEQCSGEPLDRRSDVFSLGVVLFELATGHRLFKRASDLMTLRAICEDPLVKPSDVVEDFPAELEAVIMRALSRSPKDRFATAADMRRELLAVMRSLPLDDAPDAALGELMVDMCRQRMEEKRDLLRRVARGEQLDSTIPESTDGDSMLPTALPGEPTLTRSVVWATRTASPQRPRRNLLLWGAAAAALAAAVALPRFGGEPDPSALGSFADALPVVSASAGAEVETVTLEVHSLPIGAKVELEGKALGITPLEVEVVASTSLRELRVTQRGYEPFVDSVRLTADQHLRLQLKARAQRQTRGSDPPAPRPSSSSRRDFHGFD